MEWYLGNIWYLLLLLLLPLLGAAIIGFLKWKNRRRTLFADERFHTVLFEKKSRFSRFLPVLYFIATFFLILSIVDVLKGSEEITTQQRMNNVIFLLDVSNSMNSEDIEPNRLLQAKNIMVNTMEKMRNDKVGIVVFAGEAASIMPLTTDFTAAETYISGIETSVVQIQGTDFLKAMDVVTQKFKNVAKGSRKVVMLSDGEDNEGNEKEAIRKANREGISVITVGIGSEEGAPVPEYIYGQLMGYKMDRTGQTVISKRQTSALKNIASDTGATYIDGNNMEDATVQIIDALSKSSSLSETTVKSNNAIHYYQYFLAVSLFFFVLILLFNPKRDFNI